MRRSAYVTSGALCLLLTSWAFAQELSPGKYSGSFSPGAQGFSVSISLDIKSVENGTVAGTGERHTQHQGGKRSAQGCSGSFPLTGTVKGSAVDLRAAEKFGPAGDCSFRIVGTVSGNKIVGKIGQNEVELSK